METVNTSLIEWGVAAVPFPGEIECGDQYLIKTTPSGILLAVADGLGHGDEAAKAAKMAIATLEKHAQDPVIALMQRCHEHLRDMRGATVSIASLHGLDATVTWLGVGNVETMLLRIDSTKKPFRESLVLRRGVVGGQLPQLVASILPVLRGDTLIFATDGLHHSFADGLDLSGPPQQIADHILAEYAQGTDDALVLVVRYLG